MKKKISKFSLNNLKHTNLITFKYQNFLLLNYYLKHLIYSSVLHNSNYDKLIKTDGLIDMTRIE